MQYGPHSTKKTPFVAAAARVVAGLALLSSLHTQAQEVVNCDDSMATTVANGAIYQGFCIGENRGLLNGQSELAYINQQFSLISDNWKSGGLSNDAITPFSVDPAGLKSGTLTFKTPVSGMFLIGLQGVPDPLDPLSRWYSYYLFDGGSSGVSSLSFDTEGVYKTYNIDTRTGTRSPQLALASLYLPMVPEPTTNVLLMAGLGALAWVGHRRTVKAVPADGTATA